MTESGKRDLPLQLSDGRIQDVAQPARNEIARTGERLAASYLQERGYRLLDSNWHSGRFGEIDLILESNDGLIVFAEVKTRRLPEIEADRQFAGFEDITWRKRRKLLIAARSYLSSRRLHRASCRMDVVVVYYGESRMDDHGPVLSGVQILHVPEAFSDV